MIRAVCFSGLAAVISMPACVHAQASTASFEETLGRAAFMACLSWTRDRLPVAELSSEARLRAIPRESGSDDDLWRADYSGGHLTVAQHNDGSYACSTHIFGRSASTVVAAVEKGLVSGGLPEFMRFKLVEQGHENLSDRIYRQAADARISAVLTTDPLAVGQESRTAILTFFHER